VNGEVANKTDVFVLASGGIDSTACVAYYLSEGFQVRGLFINYGQLAAERETEAVAKIMEHYDVPLDRIVVSFGREWRRGFIPGRNAFLLYAALMSFRYESGLIALRIHAGTGYWDCSQEFIQYTKPVFEAYTKGSVCVDAPFIRWNKAEIWQYCLKMGIPLKYTYSCELGRVQPCGECLPLPGWDKRTSV
jgi:7-cyano-7-deazaguanine synthase